MKRFELIEHTADIGLVAYGRSLAEAFANAAYGLFAIIAELKNVRESEYRQVEIREEDSETLLFEWLNHLLYLFDVETILFRSCSSGSNRPPTTCSRWTGSEIRSRSSSMFRG
jgi:SHS2 domain-containing protein